MSASAPLLPPGVALARCNRAVVAKRIGWPVGTLTACVELEKQHPGWLVTWQPANTIRGFEHPAAFTGRRLHERPGGNTYVLVCGETPEVLVEAMDAAPERRHWHYEMQCCSRAAR